MTDTTTKEEWIREYDLMQNRACDAEAKETRYKEALEKLADINNWMSDGYDWCWNSADEDEAYEVAQKALKGE